MNKISLRQSQELPIEFEGFSKDETKSLGLNIKMKNSSELSISNKISTTTIQQSLESSQQFSQKSIFIKKVSLQRTISVYQWRYKTCYPVVKPIKITIRHYSPNEASPSILYKRQLNNTYQEWKDQKSQENLYELNIKTERTLHFLSEIQTLQLPQLFYLIKEMIVGFECLIDIFGLFEPNENMVMVNGENQWKFWINDDFASNSKKEESNITEAEFLLKVIKMSESRLPSSTKVGRKFFDELKNMPIKKLTFLNVLDMTNTFISINKIMVAKKFVLPSKTAANLVSSLTKINQNRTISTTNGQDLKGSQNKSYNPGFTPSNMYTHVSQNSYSPVIGNNRDQARESKGFSYVDGQSQGRFIGNSPSTKEQQGAMNIMNQNKAGNFVNSTNSYQKYKNAENRDNNFTGNFNANNNQPGDLNNSLKDKEMKLHMKISELYLPQDITKNKIEKRASFLFNSKEGQNDNNAFTNKYPKKLNKTHTYQAKTDHQPKQQINSPLTPQPKIFNEILKKMPNIEPRKTISYDLEANMNHKEVTNQKEMKLFSPPAKEQNQRKFSYEKIEKCEKFSPLVMKKSGKGVSNQQQRVEKSFKMQTQSQKPQKSANRKNSYYNYEKPQNKDAFSESPNKASAKRQKSRFEQNAVFQSNQENQNRDQNKQNTLNHIPLIHQKFQRRRKYSTDYEPKIRSLDEFARKNRKLTTSGMPTAGGATEEKRTINYTNMKQRDIQGHVRNFTGIGGIGNPSQQQYRRQQENNSNLQQRHNLFDACTDTIEREEFCRPQQMALRKNEDKSKNNINNDLYNGKFQEIMKSIKSHKSNSCRSDDLQLERGGDFQGDDSASIRHRRTIANEDQDSRKMKRRATAFDVMSSHRRNTEQQNGAKAHKPEFLQQLKIDRASKTPPLQSQPFSTGPNHHEENPQNNTGSPTVQNQKTSNNTIVSANGKNNHTAETHGHIPSPHESQNNFRENSQQSNPSSPFGFASDSKDDVRRSGGGSSNFDMQNKSRQKVYANHRNKGKIAESNLSAFSCKTYEPTSTTPKPYKVFENLFDQNDNKYLLGKDQQGRRKNLSTSQDCFNSKHENPNQSKHDTSRRRHKDRSQDQQSSSQEMTMKTNNWNKKISGLFSDVPSIKVLKESSHFGDELEVFQKDYLKDVKLEKLGQFGKQLECSIQDYDDGALLRTVTPGKKGQNVLHNFSMIEEAAEETYYDNETSYLEYSTSMICQSKNNEENKVGDSVNSFGFKMLQKKAVEKSIKNCDSFEERKEEVIDGEVNMEESTGFDFQTELYRIQQK